MTFRAFGAAALFAFALAAPAAADETANFVVQLGRDTVSVERVTRSASRVDVNQVGRAPRVLGRHFVYDYQAGVISHVSLVVTPPGSTTPTQTIEATFDADSMRMQIQAGTAPAQILHVAMPKGTVVLSTSSPWAAYESQTMKLMKGKSDSLRTTMYLLGADNAMWLSLHKIGRDSVLIANEHLDVFHAKVDAAGHLLGVLPISGTGKFSVTRVALLDVPAMAAAFAAREQVGAGLGVLSPRDTVRVANAGGASLWIDYGRPGKRGRVVYGGVVPFGDVWRTGANAATQFKTDKPLAFGTTVVPAGFYTLWTVPSPNGWKLIVNSETGQWGTDHKADKDLFTIEMSTSVLQDPVERFTISVEPSASGGVIHMDWDTTRASAAFTVQP
jgi:Protein of unknown function (DUF2911)